ncbi:Alpha/beta hydrolase fold-1, partial [Mycena sp. CBHHK59/15]
MTATRYRSSASAANRVGLTLLFAHCIGAHKEQWEPTITRVLTLRSAAVREAWAVDWQSHGDAALLNRDALAAPSREDTGVLGRCDRAFLRSPYIPSGARIVLVGHSAGAAAVVLAAHQAPVPPALILIEPMLVPRAHFYAHLDARAATMELVVAGTLLRGARMRWSTRAEAQAWLGKRAPWRGWDAEVLSVYVEHGLTDEGEGKVGGTIHGVSPDAETRRPPEVHLVFARESELLPPSVQAVLVDSARPASVARVEGGHLLPQTHPAGVADAICAVLDAVGGACISRSRLDRGQAIVQ